MKIDCSGVIAIGSKMKSLINMTDSSKEYMGMAELKQQRMNVKSARQESSPTTNDHPAMQKNTFRFAN